jgi:hypothetical protein
MSLAVITKPIAPPIALTWQATSVQQYFTQINWQGPAAALPPIPIAPSPSSDLSRDLSENMRVGAFFAQFRWSAKPQPPTPSPSERQVNRPANEALLDLELLENVFLPEGKSGQDISIGDFSDFF